MGSKGWEETFVWGGAIGAFSCGVVGSLLRRFSLLDQRKENQAIAPISFNYLYFREISQIKCGR
ncbi:MAG: hypothetical protein ACPL4K_04020 [Candidatus Margulisiibacteriota bacterium]